VTTPGRLKILSRFTPSPVEFLRTWPARPLRPLRQISTIRRLSLCRPGPRPLGVLTSRTRPMQQHCGSKGQERWSYALASTSWCGQTERPRERTATYGAFYNFPGIFRERSVSFPASRDSQRMSCTLSARNKTLSKRLIRRVLAHALQLTSRHAAASPYACRSGADQPQRAQQD